MDEDSGRTKLGDRTVQTVTLRAFQRAAILAVALLIATAAAASADGIDADANTDTIEVEPSVPLGKVAPGAVLPVDVGFSLVCRNSSHVDRGQTVTLIPLSITSPVGGFATATEASIDVPQYWPLDGDSNCGGVAPLAANPASHVSLTAPMTAGIYEYSILYVRAFSPNRADLTGTPLLSGVGYTLEVVTNTPPSLVLPADMEVEGDTTGGALAAYTVGATDAQDDPAPVASCTPAPGDLLPLGPTTVDCSVTDLGGMRATGSFSITVLDRTDPMLQGLPDSTVVATPNAGGTTVDYGLPTATDIVDASPGVACAPASGSLFPVGTTTVTCTATDGSGNQAQGTFDITVRHVAVRWGEPIGDARKVSGSAGRTVPVKLQLSVDGSASRAGEPRLRVNACGGAIERWADLSWGSDRWSTNLDTSGLAGGCHRVALIVGGMEVDAFTLDLGHSEAAAGKKSATEAKKAPKG